MDKFIISVFELNSYVGDNIYSDPFFDEIWIKGEIADVNINRNTAYFILCDYNASVNCVLFNYAESGIDLIECQGTEILINGKVTLFRKNGSFKIIAEKIEHSGAGTLSEIFWQLKEKLESEGLFGVENKREIPQYPKKIGIITSKEGAAVHDLTYNIYRRNPYVKIILYPVKVQGEYAAGEIVRGIEYFNKNFHPDVLIVGRGGGSTEDLNAFNNELVVRAVFNSEIPVISAVGHENDFTLTDLAADLRVSTPTAAAERAIPLVNDIINELYNQNIALNNSFMNKIRVFEDQAYKLRNQLDVYDPRKYILKLYENFYYNKSELKQAIIKKISSLNYKLNALNEKLILLNQQTVLKSGLIRVTKNGKEILEACELNIGDLVNIYFKDGNLKAEIKEFAENYK